MLNNVKMKFIPLCVKSLAKVHHFRIIPPKSKGPQQSWNYMAVIFTRQHQPAVARVFAPQVTPGWLVIELHVMWISYDHHTSQWTFSSHPRHRERGNYNQKRWKRWLMMVYLCNFTATIPKRGSITWMTWKICRSFSRTLIFNLHVKFLYLCTPGREVAKTHSTSPFEREGRCGDPCCSSFIFVCLCVCVFDGFFL